MKINFLFGGIGESGGTKVVLDYVKFLSFKYDVCIYVCMRGTVSGFKKMFLPYVEFINYKNSKRFENSYEPKGKIKFINIPFASNRFIRDADVTIATLWITAFWLSALSNSKGKKVYFIQEHEDWGNQNRKVNGRNSYKLPLDCYITVSKMLQRKLKASYNIDANVVCNGIDQDEQHCRDYAKDDEDILIGFPYREGSRKNMETCFNVMKIFDKCKSVKICSYGPKKPNYYPKEWQFLENPSRKELFDFYENIDIFYVPSLYEGWSLPVTEAMGHGLPVVAGANFGSIVELGEDMANCVMLDNMTDTDEHIRKIQNLIENPDLRIKIGKNAYETIVSKCSFENSACKFEDILLSTCAE